ncbi:transcriptional regulator [Mannheimia varigena USDA-ARS-USMARC-1296]|nr:transcriptional regulator [Mannheimia varigena USDA-ARS-USMARC-1296]
MRLGIFPKNIEISSNRIAWLESEVINWMTTKINQRNNN